MRDYCSGCGESFKNDNMDTCQCGRSFCWRCMSEHKQATRHSSESDKGRFRVQLNDVFRRDFLSELNKKIEESQEVKSCSSLAVPQVVHTHIWFHDRSAGKQLIEYELERPAYEVLLKQLGNDREAVIKYYVEHVTEMLETTLAEIKASKLEEAIPPVKTYRVSAINQLAVVSPFRYWSTLSLSVFLGILLVALVVRNIFA